MKYLYMHSKKVTFRNFLILLIIFVNFMFMKAKWDKEYGASVSNGKASNSKLEDPMRGLIKPFTY